MKKAATLCAGAMILLASASAHAQPLPFLDGRYVTDASLCPLSDQEMANRHGDMIGTMVRIIRGDQIFDGGEMFCTVGTVNVTGENVRFRAECSSEGETETVNGRYVRVSASSFRLGGNTFSLCDATTPTPAAASSQSASSGGWYDEEFQRCDGSTVDMIQCVNGLRDHWDSRLNSAYRKLMDAEPPAQKAALRTAQRQWIAYRDANCAYYAGGEGSIARVEAAACAYALTRDRTVELEQATGQ